METWDQALQQLRAQDRVLRDLVARINALELAVASDAAALEQTRAELDELSEVGSAIVAHRSPAVVPVPFRMPHAPSPAVYGAGTVQQQLQLQEARATLRHEERRRFVGVVVVSVISVLVLGAGLGLVLVMSGAL